MHTKLTEEEKAIYEWQIWTDGFGEEGQERLKASTALISRVGGLGSPLAYALAAAGIGKLILAHAGNVKHSDLNRQITMTYDWLGKPRVESAERRLKDLNPRLEIVAVPENITENNAENLVSQSDIVFGCAPLFQERFLMNRECVNQNKPFVDAAMYNMDGRVITIIPGKTACLSCVHPEFPSEWKREFPVFAPVPGVAANIAAMEGIKVLTGIESGLAGVMLYYDMKHMEFKRIKIPRRPDCPVCGSL